MKDAAKTNRLAGHQREAAAKGRQGVVEQGRTTFRRSLVIASGLVLTALAPLTPSTAAASTSAVQQEQEALNKTIIRQAFERWAAGGNQFFNEVLSPDIRWTIKGSGPAARTYVGREAFVREAVTPFGSRLKQPLKPTIRHLLAEDDIVIAIWDGVGTARDGRPYTNSYAWIFRMRDGKATEVEAFLDLVPYYDVLNRVPDPQ